MCLMWGGSLQCTGGRGPRELPTPEERCRRRWREREKKFLENAKMRKCGGTEELKKKVTGKPPRTSDTSVLVIRAGLSSKPTSPAETRMPGPLKKDTAAAAASLAQTAARAFQPRQEFPDYRVVLAQLKGHQTKALHRMAQLAPQINLVVELRDARAPLATANVLLDKVFKGKDKLIVYTKKDMSPVSSQLLQRWHAPRNEKWLAIDSRKNRDVALVLRALREKHRSMLPPPPLGLRLMVAGMPNVGKSTLVNELRRHGLAAGGGAGAGGDERRFRKVARTGNMAGVTRNTSEIIRISAEPQMLLYDTPGVLLPQVDSVRTMLALYLAGTVSASSSSDGGIDPVIATDYLLYMMNLADPSGAGYRRYLPHPTNDVYELLDGVGRLTGNRNRRKIDGGKLRTNYVGCALELVKEFQQGRLGRWCLDEAVVRQLSPDAFSEQAAAERRRVDSLPSRLGKTLDPDAAATATDASAAAAKTTKAARRRERLVKQSNQLFTV